MERRDLNVMFRKAGSGSISAGITLPKTWVDKMGITAENRMAEVEFDGEKITISRKKL